MIDVINKTRSLIDLILVKKTAEKFLKKYKIKKDVSIAFIGDSEMKKINKKYRHQDKTTDVLSFPGDDDFFGEILISYSVIKKQSKKFGNTATKELIYILVHGLIHLLGYSDETDKESQEMKKIADKFIKNHNYLLSAKGERGI